MDIMNLLGRVFDSPCSRCLYKQGKVKTLIDPCPLCKMQGYNNPFANRSGLAPFPPESNDSDRDRDRNHNGRRK